MGLIEAIIIYLACGTPFGVHHFVEKPSTNIRRIFGSLWVTVAWIGYLPLFLHRLVTSGLTGPEHESSSAATDVQAALKEQCRQIEAAAEGVLGVRGIYEARGALERYSGIAEMMSQDLPNEPSESGLSRISSHPSPATHGAVTARRNRAIIERHHRSSIKEMFDLYDRITIGVGADAEIRKAFAKVFALYGNSEAESLLLRSEPAASEGVVQEVRPRTVKPKWRELKSQQKSKSTPADIGTFAMMSQMPNED